MRYVLIILCFVTTKLYSQYEIMGIAQNHQKHFATSVALNGMFYITAYDYYYVQNPLTAEYKAQVAAATITISTGVLKELYDYTIHKRNGTWDDVSRGDMYTDLLANILGVITVTATINLFK
jgi:hypothetical protein